MGSEWRPIETAPKDGTRFLVWGAGCQRVELCEWCDRVGAWDTTDGMLEDWDRQAEGYSRPTHWQPLPDPPASPGEGGTP